MGLIHVNLFKYDIFLQGFPKTCLSIPFIIYYANVMRIFAFTYKNEVKETSWKFLKYKHEMMIDEVTFQFDLVNRSGSADAE